MRALQMAIAMVALAVTGCARDAHPFHGNLLEPPLPAVNAIFGEKEQAVRLSDFRGKLIVLFFGYTSCPDVCPATLQRWKNTIELLGDQAGQVQVIMVSVDPERDSSERITSYASAFHPGFRGLTGNTHQIADAAASLGIFYSKTGGGSDEPYLIDHSSQVVLLNREGQPRMIWSNQVSPGEMAADLRRLLKRSRNS